MLKRGTDIYSGATFLAGAVSSWITRDQDDYTRSEWRSGPQITDNEANIGNLLGTGAAGALIIGGQYLWDPNESNYQSHFRGFVYGGIGIYTLKTAFGRNRPGLSNSHQSFPSGHTAITFMTATHLAYAYGWEAAVFAFPIATFVGVTRLHDDAHWLSDTVGGAFLGILIGRATYYDSSAWEKSTSSSFQIQLMPVIQHDVSGVSMHVSY